MSAQILFAPGAGAPSSSEWMERFAEGLERIAPTTRFDYDYMRAARRRPDPQAKLVETHKLALLTLPHPEETILVGKSMGSRMGCHLSLETSVRGLVCFGYPLVGAGKRQSVRDEVLRQLNTPILFVQGTRDPLCPLPLLAEVRAQMSCRTELYVVESADHSLKVTATELRKNGETQSDVEERIFDRVAAFCASLT